MESFLTIRLINVLHIPIVILFWTKATPWWGWGWGFLLEKINNLSYWIQ